MTQSELSDIEPSFNQKTEFNQIHTLLTQASYLEAEIENAEDVLSKMKELYRSLTENTIPDLMRELGLESFTTPDGKNVSINKFYSAKIPLSYEAEAFQWLEDTGNASIVKNDIVISLKKDEQELINKAAQILSEAGLPFARKMNIHPSTLKAFVKERIESGQPLPMEMFGVFIGERVKVKE